ncbi:hypothetical protein M569_08281, partial [Genlisea aurea]
VSKKESSSTSMEDDSLGFGVDLVSAARKNLGLFKTVADNHWLHQDSAIAEAIRRYDEVWMPLLAHLSTGPNPPLILPPLDVEWVWFCHSLDPVNYKQYCDSRFSKLISKTAIFDEENREYALNRSKRMWEAEFPAEPFEAADADDDVAAAFPPSNRNLSDRVSKQTEIYYKRFSEPSKQQRPFSSGGGSSLRQSMSFTWNDLLRAPSLSSCKEFNNGRLMRVHASITPPVEASYLLRCVPDRVTDDSGAMISDVYLKMNRHRPQSGRWLTRTVVDHAARECFVIRMRVGVGFWRWGGEVPKAVGREDRIIEIRQGAWSYVYGSTSIGRAPEKIVGTATPREPPEGYQFSWSFSTRNELFMQWDHPPSSPSVSALRLQFKTSSSEKTTVELLPGRQRQYRVRKPNPETAPDEDDGFITMIRFSDESPYGKATALLNWKHLVVDYLPEEDTVLVLLLCLAILRGISVMKREDVGNLLMRRRVQVSPDCGSVILHPSSQPPHPPPCAQPWYWNPNSVMAAAQEKGHFAVAASSPVEGSDELYRTGII